MPITVLLLLLLLVMTPVWAEDGADTKFEGARGTLATYGQLVNEGKLDAVAEAPDSPAGRAGFELGVRRACTFVMTLADGPRRRPDVPSGSNRGSVLRSIRLLGSQSACRSPNMSLVRTRPRFVGALALQTWALEASGSRGKTADSRFWRDGICNAGCATLAGEYAM